MARQSLPAIPRVCQQCGLAWTQQDGKAPRAYCSTSCRNEAERQAAGTDNAARAASADAPVRVYTRRVRAQRHTILGAWCQQEATLEQYPGPVPRYCSAVCRAEAARESAAMRMRRMRARRRLAASAVTTTESS
jgi:hypothetical protein